jgi:hypothetical protein
MDRAISTASQSFIPPTDPAAPPAIGDELMTVNDAARFLRVSVSWVYEHTRDDADAQHLHARRRRVASRGDRAGRTPVVPTVPKSQEADSGPASASVTKKAG